MTLCGYKIKRDSLWLGTTEQTAVMNFSNLNNKLKMIGLWSKKKKKTTKKQVTSQGKSFTLQHADMQVKIPQSADKEQFCCLCVRWGFCQLVGEPRQTERVVVNAASWTNGTARFMSVLYGVVYAQIISELMLVGCYIKFLSTVNGPAVQSIHCY